jgi:hypothetical protein
MRIMKTVTTAVSIIALGTASMAGGLSDEIMEAPVEVVDEMAPATSSVKPIYIILGVLAAVAIGAALAEDDDDEEDVPVDDTDDVVLTDTM